MINIKYFSDEEAKKAICDIGQRMYLRNFVAANDGNISIRVAANEVWTTPTGVSKGYLKPEMLVKVDLKGNVIEGLLKPSSELKMHLRVYELNDQALAVTHAHPIAATSFAIARQQLDLAILPEAIVFLGVVPIASYAKPGSAAIPDSITPFVKDYNVCLLANHGALTWGKDIYEAFYRMESLEHYANILINTKYIIRAYTELNTREVNDLMDIRKDLGIENGGRFKTKDESFSQSDDFINDIIKEFKKIIS
ncbi:MAG: class II aldolase/adducin family protein [Bacilli bacterium]